MGKCNETVWGTKKRIISQPTKEQGMAEDRRCAVDETGCNLAWAANIKRTYDEYQDIALTAARRSQENWDKVQAVSLQALQNAVTHSDALAKQGLRFNDIAVNKQWNLEPSEAASESVTLRSVTIDDTSLKAIGAAVAAAVVSALGNK